MKISVVHPIMLRSYNVIFSDRVLELAAGFFDMMESFHIDDPQ